MSEIIIGAIAAGVVLVLGKIGEVVVNIVKAKNEPELKKMEIEEEREDKIMGGIDQLKEIIQTQTEVLKSTQVVEIRHSITSLYYQYQKQKKLPAQMKENVSYLFEEYKKLGGNSYINRLYEEMMNWDVE